MLYTAYVAAVKKQSCSAQWQAADHWITMMFLMLALQTKLICLLF